MVSRPRGVIYTMPLAGGQALLALVLGQLELIGHTPEIGAT
jgi:hypothetical protein